MTTPRLKTAFILLFRGVGGAPQLPTAPLREALTEALRPGAYLRIVVEGDVGAGDAIRVVQRPGHDLTVRDVFRIYTRDREEAGRLLAVPGMSEAWRRWADDFLQKTRDRPAAEAEPGCC